MVNLDGTPVAQKTITRMTDSLTHRGPDDEGAWTSGPVGLGSRRLAILDLSAAGHQPMSNETGDIVTVYNGEIYNFQSLRLELEAEGHRFHSRTDTEVVVHAYEQWGEDCLSRFNGHFALAVWDGPHQRLFLARDRFGVKPLYYLYARGTLIFGSEVKALLTYPGVQPAVSHDALAQYFTFQNVLTDQTLFSGIHLLAPGTSLTLDARDGRPPQQRRYWDFEFPTDYLDISEAEAAEELERLFVQAVTRQLVSDVPVASYLSGGMDSGSITAVARRQLGRLLTFTCGFDLSSASGLELAFDERANAEALSNRLKTEHYEVVLHAGDMEHVMPELIWHLEDLRVGQCYPNYYVARLAGKFVKVVLSGAGGDELFAGYPWRYFRTPAAGGGREQFYRGYYGFWQRLVSDEDKPLLFNAATRTRLADHSTFELFKGVIEGAQMPLETNADYVNASLYFELKTFLHGLLIVEDKVSMAHSLETRCPFLDNDLVDFALRLPIGVKLRGVDRTAINVDENEPAKRLQTGDGKRVLRRAMSRIVPPDVVERSKQGFSAPDASWFRGESIDYINTLLRTPKARVYDFLSHDYVTERLDEHTSGARNHRLFIWSLVSFEWWLRKFIA